MIKIIAAINKQVYPKNLTIRNQCGHCQKQTDIKNKG